MTQPATARYFDPYLSLSQPARGNVTTFCSEPIPAAIEVDALFNTMSAASGLKMIEAPCTAYPVMKAKTIETAIFIHQPK